MEQKIVWDTEYTSWDGCNENGWDETQNQYKEIIQIGAVKLNQNNQIIDWFTRYVQPEINPDLSKYIKDLTGIKQLDVDTTRKLPYIWNEFTNWQDGCPAYSWENDIEVIKRNKELYQNIATDSSKINTSIDAEKINTMPINSNLYYDIRPLLRYFGIPTEEYSSGTVCTFFSSDYTITEHDALEDARSLALSLQDANE